jgi:hypothetical protein
MSTQEFILKLSSEGRQWAQMLMPILIPAVTAYLAGLHMPQPKYMEKKEP